MDKLCKAFGGKAVLQDFSCELEEGRVTALMAPSGAGKTTLLRILLGLETADSGEITGLSGKRLAAVFQEDRLLDFMTPVDNIRLPEATRARVIAETRRLCRGKTVLLVTHEAVEAERMGAKIVGLLDSKG